MIETTPHPSPHSFDDSPWQGIADPQAHISPASLTAWLPGAELVFGRGKWLLTGLSCCRAAIYPIGVCSFDSPHLGEPLPTTVCTWSAPLHPLRCCLGTVFSVRRCLTFRTGLWPATRSYMYSTRMQHYCKRTMIVMCFNRCAD